MPTIPRLGRFRPRAVPAALARPVERGGIVVRYAVSAGCSIMQPRLREARTRRPRIRSGTVGVHSTHPIRAVRNAGGLNAPGLRNERVSGEPFWEPDARSEGGHGRPSVDDSDHHLTDDRTGPDGTARVVATYGSEGPVN